MYSFCIGTRAPAPCDVPCEAPPTLLSAAPLAFQYSSLASSLHEAARASGRGTLLSRSGGGRPLVCRMMQEMSSTIACKY